MDFAGLAPGFAGLYQINAAVPAGVHGDTLPVVLSWRTARPAGHHGGAMMRGMSFVPVRPTLLAELRKTLTYIVKGFGFSFPAPFCGMSRRGAISAPGVAQRSFRFIAPLLAFVGAPLTYAQVTVAPSSLTFTVQRGGPAPNPQTIAVSAPSGTDVEARPITGVYIVSDCLRGGLLRSGALWSNRGYHNPPRDR